MRVTVASTMNTPSRISQAKRSLGADHPACNAKAAIMKPRNPLPASPMKIFAGGQFQRRNPAVDAASRSGAIQSGVAGAKRTASTLPPAHTVIASTLAMPSMPSMKLVRFRSQTIISAAMR